MAMVKVEKPLSLHVPEPGCRPGDKPDFSNFEIPKAGEVRRPEIDASPETMRDMAFSIIRVLNKKGEAVGGCLGSSRPCPINEHRAEPVSTPDHVANRETELTQLITDRL